MREQLLVVGTDTILFPVLYRNLCRIQSVGSYTW
jgi:hypothetical protein